MLAGVTAHAISANRLTGHSSAPDDELPRWPLAMGFTGYWLGWILGLGDMLWILSALLMVIVLWPRRAALVVPKWFGLWLLFLGLVFASSIGLDSTGRVLGFAYRAALYLAATIIFIYVYNGRRNLGPNQIGLLLAALWVQTLLGGWLGLLWPTFQWTTPLARVLPKSLLNNDLVQEMVIRRFTNYNPDAWNPLFPRPSAPFLYTNGWGNVYSVLTPVVIAWIITHWQTRTAKLLALLVPVSLVPALLTLNRGMFIGLGVAGVYIAIRHAGRINLRQFLIVVTLGGLGYGLFSLLPVAERLTTRLGESSTTADRATLYWETFYRTLESPILGFGAPRPASVPWLPSLGTQGHIWQLMFSHGFIALGLFLLWLLVTFIGCHRHKGLLAEAISAGLVVTLVESFYYGVLGTGLIVVLTPAAALLASRTKPASPGE